MIKPAIPCVDSPLAHAEIVLLRHFREAGDVGRDHIQLVACLGAAKLRTISENQKPGLQLHSDGTVSLKDAALPYYFNRGSVLNRAQISLNIRRATGSLQKYCDRFGLSKALLRNALGSRTGVAMGGQAGALRILLNLPTCSSKNTTPLDHEFCIHLDALRIASGLGAVIPKPRRRGV
ncbi:hypothetical protein [Ramlibacter sp.]|uniref:hypothetical protein n=1 Tax=Ramlibacter sp. TaxID=1917967 RepID=UPI003D09A21C